MALIQVGSFEDFSVERLSGSPAVQLEEQFHTLAAARHSEPADRFQFMVSRGRRGLALQTLRLGPATGALNKLRGLLSRLLNRGSYVYFIAWLWDLSGQPIALYPGHGVPVDQCLIPIRSGTERQKEFLGAGALLFPARPISS